MSGYWNGDEWRWRPAYHRARTEKTVQVPDNPEAEKAREEALKDGAVEAPFGFGRELFEANVSAACDRLEQIKNGGAS